MYRVLIVEDEERTRSALTEYFRTEHRGELEIVGEAENGREALEQMESIMPDVVITDIKMPIMDGIELAKEIRERYNGVKIIFISGYDDTDYLKSALNLDAINYIFKPVDFDELDKVVGYALNIVKHENAIKEDMRELNRKLDKSMPLLRDKFFVNLIRGGYSVEDKVFEQAEFLGLNIHRSVQYCIMVAEIDNYVNWSSQMTEMERQAFFFGVLNVMDEIIGRYMNGFTFENEQGEFVALLELPDSTYSDKIYTVAEEVRDNICRYLECEISIGIGKNVRILTAVQQSYNMAKRALKSKLFLGNANIIAIDEPDNTEDSGTAFWEDEIFSVESVLLNNDESAMKEYLVRLKDNMNEKRCSRVICQMNFIYLVTRIQQVAERMGAGADLKEQPTAVIEKLCNVDTLDGMYKIVSDYAVCVMKYIGELRKTKSINAIESAKRIIREHYADNITIEKIADMVYLTSAYLCVLFKQETGYTITDYRTLVRMEKAKELLKDFSNKIYDIAYAVGYENPSYFSLQFKKTTGMLPKDYRETIKYENEKQTI